MDCLSLCCSASLSNVSSDQFVFYLRLLLTLVEIVQWFLFGIAILLVFHLNGFSVAAWRIMQHVKREAIAILLACGDLRCSHGL